MCKKKSNKEYEVIKMKTKKNRYADVSINVTSVNKGRDCSITMRKLYEIILKSEQKTY